MCQYISQQVEKRERDNESDDVESNLLLPAGIALRWVTFLLKIYRAEDIPQSTSVLITCPLVYLIAIRNTCDSCLETFHEHNTS